MKGNKKTIFSVAALVIAAALMLGLWYLARPDTQTGDKTIVVQVIHADKSENSFTYHTGAEYLGEVLLAEELAEGTKGPYGLFITTVDGETAQDSLNQWWCITKGGEQVDTGADMTPITDGDHFELTISTY